MEITYDLILKYLCNKKYNTKKIYNDLENKETQFNNFNKLEFCNKENTLKQSLNILIDYDESNDTFSDEELLNNLSEKLNLNILVLSNNNKLYSPKNIIDLSLPFILLHYDKYYSPLYQNDKKIFFYNDEDIEEILDEKIKVNHNKYQFLDNYEEIIDDILNKPKITNTKIDNKLFVNEDEVKDYQDYNKLTKAKLINLIMEKNTNYKKSQLNKIKKNDLIKMLLS